MSKHIQQVEPFADRREFQLERLILFSDAVFAIAITLLIIEIKTPAISELTSAALLHSLNEKSSEFFGFVLSFVVIGIFWISHHRLFGFVTGYDNGLLWLNLHMLLWIVFVPFTSGLNSRYGGMDIVWIIYSLNMFMISISILFLYRYVSKKGRHLSTLADLPLERKYFYYRSISTSLIFLSAVLLCIMDNTVTSWTARFIYLLIPVSIAIINKRLAAQKRLAVNKGARSI